MKRDEADIISQITRRQWLLRVGETAALAGISGLVPEFPLRMFATQLPALPPGLYEPSSDALVHALSHKPSAVPVGSETDYVRHDVPYQLSFFSENEFQTAKSIVSIFLGHIDTSVVTEVANWIDLWFYSAQRVREGARKLDPLHRALAVAYFGESAVIELEVADPAQIALHGLQELDDLCRDKYKNAFIHLAGPEQLEIVNSISTGPDSSGREFLQLLRNQAIGGYYTSAEGLKDLDYKGNAYYPICPGCETAPKE